MCAPVGVVQGVSWCGAFDYVSLQCVFSSVRVSPCVRVSVRLSVCVHCMIPRVGVSPSVFFVCVCVLSLCICGWKCLTVGI